MMTYVLRPPKRSMTCARNVPCTRGSSKASDSPATHTTDPACSAGEAAEEAAGARPLGSRLRSPPTGDSKWRGTGQQERTRDLGVRGAPGAPIKSSRTREYGRAHGPRERTLKGRRQAILQSLGDLLLVLAKAWTEQSRRSWSGTRGEEHQWAPLGRVGVRLVVDNGLLGGAVPLHPNVSRITSRGGCPHGGVRASALARVKNPADAATNLCLRPTLGSPLNQRLAAAYSWVAGLPLWPPEAEQASTNFQVSPLCHRHCERSRRCARVCRLLKHALSTHAKAFQGPLSTVGAVLCSSRR